MAPHSSTPAWRIPWMEKPGGLQSMASLRVRHGLSNFTFTFHFHALEMEMATHSSVLAWRIPGTGGAWWAAVYGVSQSRTRLNRLSSSSNSIKTSSDGKASVYNVGDLGVIPGSGRFSGKGNGNSLQYSCLENLMEGGAWCRLLSMGFTR